MTIILPIKNHFIILSDTKNFGLGNSNKNQFENLSFVLYEVDSYTAGYGCKLKELQEDSNFSGWFSNKINCKKAYVDTYVEAVSE